MMKLTSSIKEQLTKTFKLAPHVRKVALRSIFARYMPCEQAKHAARKYLAAHPA